MPKKGKTCRMNLQYRTVCTVQYVLSWRCYVLYKPPPLSSSHHQQGTVLYWQKQINHDGTSCENQAERQKQQKESFPPPRALALFSLTLPPPSLLFSFVLCFSPLLVYSPERAVLASDTHLSSLTRAHIYGHSLAKATYSDTPLLDAPTIRMGNAVKPNLRHLSLRNGAPSPSRVMEISNLVVCTVTSPPPCVTRRDTVANDRQTGQANGFHGTAFLHPGW